MCCIHTGWASVKGWTRKYKSASGRSIVRLKYVQARGYRDTGRVARRHSVSFPSQGTGVADKPHMIPFNETNTTALWGKKCPNCHAPKCLSVLIQWSQLRTEHLGNRSEIHIQTVKSNTCEWRGPTRQITHILNRGPQTMEATKTPFSVLKTRYCPAFIQVAVLCT